MGRLFGGQVRKMLALRPTQAHIEAISIRKNLENPVQLQRLSYPFYVRGVEHERSMVTGRRGQYAVRDGGCSGVHPTERVEARLELVSDSSK